MARHEECPRLKNLKIDTSMIFFLFISSCSELEALLCFIIIPNSVGQTVALGSRAKNS